MTKSSLVYASIYETQPATGEALAEDCTALVVFGATPWDCARSSYAEGNVLYRLKLLSGPFKVPETGYPSIVEPADDPEIPEANIVRWAQPWSGVARAFVTAPIAPVSMRGWFAGCRELQSIEGLSLVDTSRVTNMANLFSACSSLQTLDVSHFDTSQVTDMSNMFNGCDELIAIDVSGFDTARVRDFTSMFASCSKLTWLDVSGFDASSAATMANMFSRCRRLRSLDLSRFETVGVRRMSGMFWGCAELEWVDLSGFDTSAVRDFFLMFADCKRLTSLDLSSFDFSSAKNLNLMFRDCANLRHLALPEAPIRWADTVKMRGTLEGCVALDEESRAAAARIGLEA